MTKLTLSPIDRSDIDAASHTSNHDSASSTLQQFATRTAVGATASASRSTAASSITQHEAGRSAHSAAASFDDMSTANRRLQTTKRMQRLVTAVLSIVLVTCSIHWIGPPLEAWRSDDVSLQIHSQLTEIESRVALLRVDTATVVQHAKAFLKQHHRVQVSVTARTHLVVRAGEQSLAENARERLAHHSFVLKDAVVFQASQRERTNETHARLRALNISLPSPPVEKPVRALPVTKSQLLQLREIHRREQQLNASIIALVVDATREAAADTVAEAEAQRRRAVVSMTLDALRQLEAEIDAHSERQAKRHASALVLYSLVVIVTGAYLWMTAAERKRRQSHDSSRKWSPVPRFMLQIKDVLKSAVMIEDLGRDSNDLLVDTSDDMDNDDLGSVMVRTFATTPRVAQTRAARPSSNRKL